MSAENFHVGGCGCTGWGFPKTSRTRKCSDDVELNLFTLPKAPPVTPEEKLRDLISRYGMGYLGPAIGYREAQAAAWNAFFEGGKRSLLLIADTAAGKTIIALGIASHFVLSGKRVLYATENVALIDQGRSEAVNKFSFPQEIVCGITGETHAPPKRREIYQDQTKQLLFGTPVFLNDIEAGTLSLNGVGLAVIDEAHLARGEHPLTKFVAALREADIPILFMSATLVRNPEKRRLIHELVGTTKEFVCPAKPIHKPQQRYPASFHDSRLGTFPDMLSASQELWKLCVQSLQELREHPDMPDAWQLHAGRRSKAAPGVSLLPAPGFLQDLGEMLSKKAQENPFRYRKLQSLSSQVHIACGLYRKLMMAGRQTFLSSAAKIMLNLRKHQNDIRNGKTTWQRGDPGKCHELIAASPLFRAAFALCAQQTPYWEAVSADFVSLWKRYGGERPWKKHSWPWIRERILEGLEAHAALTMPIDHPKEIATTELIAHHLSRNPDERFVVCVNEVLACRFRAVRLSAAGANNLFPIPLNRSVPALPYYGGLPLAEKRLTLEKFRRGDVKVLFATSAFELGQDIEGVKVLIVENHTTEPERRKQRKGRVGRGQAPVTPGLPAGLIYEVVTPGTEDELIVEIGKRKERQMNESQQPEDLPLFPNL